jgi:hypothetical protein
MLEKQCIQQLVFPLVFPYKHIAIATTCRFFFITDMQILRSMEFSSLLFFIFLDGNFVLHVTLA